MLLDGSLEAREQHLAALLDRVRDHGDAAAAAALRDVVRDYRDHHRSIYSRALNHIDVFGDASLEEPLLAALADTRHNCQAWAAKGCGVLGFRAATPGLIALLDRDDWMCREEAATALGAVGDDTVVPVLAPLLLDRSESLRRCAAEALARIGGDAAFAALWDAFEHRAFPRIGHIASTLAMFPPDTVIPALVTAAASDDADTRYWAAVALGSTGDDRAAPVLERLLDDRGTTVFDGWVSVAAKKALRTSRRIQAAIAAREANSAGG